MNFGNKIQSCRYSVTISKLSGSNCYKSCQLGRLMDCDTPLTLGVLGERRNVVSFNQNASDFGPRSPTAAPKFIPSTLTGLQSQNLAAKGLNT